MLIYHTIQEKRCELLSIYRVIKILYAIVNIARINNANAFNE